MNRTSLACFLCITFYSSVTAQEYSYQELIERITDLRWLAQPPLAGEVTLAATSYDRSAKYHSENGETTNWGANRDAKNGLRYDGDSLVVMDVKQPGCIWRVWADNPGAGRIRIFLDGAEEPVVDSPFREFFEATKGEWKQLISTGQSGFVSHLPIAFGKSCKILLDDAWGEYYRFDYSKMPKTAKLPTYGGSWTSGQRRLLKQVDERLATGTVTTDGTDAQIIEQNITLAPGQADELSQLKGSRAITSIEATLPADLAALEYWLRAVTISIYWDQQNTASVWAPLGDFFAVAPKARVVRTYIAGKQGDILYARWYMPFAKGARIRIENDGKSAISLKFKIKHVDEPRAAKLLRFHAKWHRDDFTGVTAARFQRGGRWPDWPVTVVKGPGRFCGLHLDVWNPNPKGVVNNLTEVPVKGLPFRIADSKRQATWRWLWSEGDEKIIVDGDPAASSFGTGTDHYFGFVENGGAPTPFNRSFAAKTVSSRVGHVAATRFHVADSIPFHKRLEAVLEKYQPNSVLQYAVSAFWYQTAGTRDPYRPVSVSGRLDYHTKIARRIPHPVDGYYEGEKSLEPGTNARAQNMRSYAGKWRGDTHLLWHGKFGDSTKMEFQAPRDSEYLVTIQFTKAPDYGLFELILDGKPLKKRVDLYSPRVELAPLHSLGTLRLKEGVHTLAFKLVGANKKGNPYRPNLYLLGVDYLRLQDQEPIGKVVATTSSLSLNESRIVATAEQLTPRDFAQLNKLLVANCSSCHGRKRAEGELRLDKLKKREDFFQHIKLSRKMLIAVRDGEMPPKDEGKITPQDRSHLVRLLNRVVLQYTQSRKDLPPIVMRRLNRYEYNNAVKHLLNLRGDIYPLPEKTIRSSQDYFNPASGRFPDTIRVGNRTLGKFQVERQFLTGVVPFAIDLQAEHGFNNRGDELGISPLLLETLVKLGQAIVNSPQFDAYCLDFGKVFAGPKRQAGEAAEAFKRRQIAEARKRIANLLYRAFRTRVGKSIQDRYVQFFSTHLERNGFTAAMKNTVAAIISSPRFIYLIEARGDSKDTQAVTEFELATRLSFFLWSSLPDAELLQLAREGKLSEKSVLDAQVQRMLKDKRCKAIATNFARQWLRLDQLVTAVPDRSRFPTYYSRIGCEYWKFGLQTMIEPLLLFESMMVEDRSILQLVDSDFTYRSDEMEIWYNDPAPFARKNERSRFNTNQQDFKRRHLRDRRQGGVMTTAAVMTMTSEPLRTSPILRGSWVATVMFNRPPDPPPDVVPEIEADDAEIEAKGLTLRQRLKEHQSNKSCAACHSKIDPFGFALENYDSVGRWRKKYRSGLPIDTSGKLFGEAEFTNVVEFKDAILAKPQIFAKAFTEHLLSYALGRELEVSDQAEIDRIVTAVLEDEGRFSTVVRQIVASRLFLSKTKSSALSSTENKK